MGVENLPDLPGFGVSPEPRFLEYWYTVTDDFEPAAPRRDQLDLDPRVVVPELSRQTGGSGLVVSKGAVLDADFHRFAE